MSRENIAIRKTQLTHSQVTPAQVAVVQTPDIWLSAIDQDDMILTVLICIAFPLLIQGYPQWKVYSAVAFVSFLICGRVLMYFHSKEHEADQTQIDQLKSDLEEATKEAKKQKAAAIDASETVNALVKGEDTPDAHCAERTAPSGRKHPPSKTLSMAA